MTKTLAQNYSLRHGYSLTITDSILLTKDYQQDKPNQNILKNKRIPNLVLSAKIPNRNQPPYNFMNPCLLHIGLEYIEEFLPYETLADFVHILHEHGLFVNQELFYHMGYFPIEDDFMNFLVLNYTDCEFFNFKNQTYICLKKVMNKSRTEFLMPFPPNKIPPILSSTPYKSWMVFWTSETNLPSSIKYLLVNKYFSFFESIFYFYRSLLNTGEILANFLNKSSLDRNQLCKLLFQQVPYLLEKENEKNSLHLIEILENKYSSDLDLLKLMLKHRIKDFNYRLLKVICENGDLECINLYIDNLTLVKDEAKNDKSLVKSSLDKLKLNKHINKPQFQYYRLNRLILS